MNIYDIIGKKKEESPVEQRRMTEDEYRELFEMVQKINLKVKHIHELDVKEALERIAKRLNGEE